MADIKQDNTAEAAEEEQATPLESWDKRPYVRAKWVLITHGERVLPPNEQNSNTELPDSAVMKPREEPIGSDSDAIPMNPKSGRGGNEDWSGAKQIRSS